MTSGVIMRVAAGYEAMEFAWFPPGFLRADDSYQLMTVGVFLFSGGGMETTYAAAWVALLIFLASVISVELALSAAIIEIAFGVVAGNVLGLHPAPWGRARDNSATLSCLLRPSFPSTGPRRGRGELPSFLYLR